MLVVVNTAIFRKFSDSIDYVYATKDKNFYFYPYNGEDIVFIRVSKGENDNKYSSCFYVPLESILSKISDKDHQLVEKYAESISPFIGEKYFAYDIKRKEVVFDLDNGELITDKYWHLHLPITDGCTYFAYFNETKNGILTKRTAFVEKKPEILAMLSAEIAARFLNFSAETQEFGATIAYLAGCIFENMVPKLESYTELKQYLKGGKKESDVYTRKLSTKRLDILMEKLNENLLEKKEEKVEKKDIITSRFLSDVINTGLIFTVVPVSIILDKDLEDKIPVKIISIEGIRGGLVFITDDLKIFRSGANTDILFKLKNLTKMENISLIYRNFEY